MFPVPRNVVVMMLQFPPTSSRVRRAMATALVALGVVVAASPVDASVFHLGLKKSEPATGASLTSIPPEVKLWFTAQPQLRLTRLVLVGPVGEVTLGKPTQAPGADAPVVFPVQGGGQAGSYTAKWVTAGKDGHPIKGEFSFAIK